MIADAGEEQAARSIENGGQGGYQSHSGGKADALDDGLFLRQQSQTAGDVDIEHEPDAHIVADGPDPDNSDDTLTLFLFLWLVPVSGFFKQQMSCEHHYEIYSGKNVEHFIYAALTQIIQQGLHDGAGNGLCGAETCNGKACGKAFLLAEPQHQRFYGGEVSCAQTDAHDETIAYVYSDKCHDAALVQTAVVNEEAGTDHAQGKGDGRNQRGLVYVSFHDVAEKRRRHAQKENGKAEGPLCGGFGEADIVCDLLTEDGPAVDGADTAVDEQGRDCGANPFIAAPITGGFFDGVHSLGPFWDDMYEV